MTAPSFPFLTAVLLAGLVGPTSAETVAAPMDGDITMTVLDLYPLITTPALSETRDFYVRHFGFAVVFEASWFVYLSQPGEDGARGATLAFMHPDHPSSPPGPESFEGKGMILTVQVDDAAATLNRLQSGGAPVVYPLTDEDWGQRRFMTRDPAGVLLDVVQQTAPTDGYWERFPLSLR